MFVGPREGSIVFSCSRSSWRRHYLECIKIIVDQALVSLGLVHNEKNTCYLTRTQILQDSIVKIIENKLDMILA
ncbi:unnamed protein product [Spirodela intermedia]|uniref:Uncharacterized protein n=1 Tax=Spirodela intermedia TaxID=51605 RepID=A0A7I8JTC5_SPIIN|nr:unnamed protein product [Spirodela intermedia]CAA6673430.1 unnamed protein product [Spirodela intermedia]